MSSPRGYLSIALSWLIAAFGVLCRTALIAWATLAIYYSNLQWAGFRLGLAAAFATFAIWAFWFSSRRHMSALAIVSFLGVVAWWISIPPRTIATGDRKSRSCHEQLSTAIAYV